MTAAATTSQPTSPETFKSVMSTLANSVSVVTTTGANDSPYGLTCSAFMSVSAKPPIVAVGIHSRSRAISPIHSNQGFCVNILTEDRHDIAQTFASHINDRFTHVSWSPTRNTRSPLITNGALAHFDCRLRDIVTAGDHVLVLGEVLECVTHSPASSPLVHCQRTFGTWSPNQQ